jgi:hypothetical protein
MAKPAPQNQVAYYESHPPSCLAGFAVQPTSLPDVEFDGHGASGDSSNGFIECPNILFKINCSCGGHAHRLIAEATVDPIDYYNESVCAGRYWLQCAACRAAKVLFDASLHGYDQEADRMRNRGDEPEGGGPSQGGEGEKVDYRCRACQADAFQIIARYEYNPFTFDDPDFARHAQDFFSWFSVVAECVRCSEIHMAVDQECA